MVVMHPAGDVAVQERDLILVSTALMLLIIVPVMALTVLFAWRYRASNAEATYDPEWHHSTGLEVAIWAAPLAIIIALGAMTWISTHVLDPYRPIARISPGRPTPANVQPLTVDVVAMNWKWLFIYPQLGIASVNELAAPVNTPIAFRITSTTMMNAFFIPSLAGQIYAMPGMQTQMHAVINAPGVYEGFSSNYSGDGFSGMKFKYYGMRRADFDRWVRSVKAGGVALDRAGYLKLAEPSQNAPVERFASVDPDLFSAVVNACVAPGTPCLSDIMRQDAAAGALTKKDAADAPPPSPAMPMMSTPSAKPSPAMAPASASLHGAVR
jgi:cytochrome o ubiquinol oxidase subunit 2